MSPENISDSLFSPKRASVIGLGKLGSPMAVCLANSGYQVVGMDINQEYVLALSEGRAPVFEPYLQEMITSVGDKLKAIMGSRAKRLTMAPPKNPDDSNPQPEVEADPGELSQEG